MKYTSKELREAAAAQVKESDAIHLQWSIAHDAATRVHGGGSPWAKVNVPEGAVYLAGSAWSHWPTDLRTALLDLLAKSSDAMTKAYHTYKRSRGRDWHSFRNEYSYRG